MTGGRGGILTGHLTRGSSRMTVVGIGREVMLVMAGKAQMRFRLGNGGREGETRIGTAIESLGGIETGIGTRTGAEMTIMVGILTGEEVIVETGDGLGPGHGRPDVSGIVDGSDPLPGSGRGIGMKGTSGGG